jgi:hypothetical protein
MSFVDTNVQAGGALSDPASPPLDALLDPLSDPEPSRLAPLSDPEPPLLDPLLDPEALESNPCPPPSVPSVPLPFPEPPQPASAPTSTEAHASTTPVDERRSMMPLLRRGCDGPSLGSPELLRRVERQSMSPPARRMH